MHFKTDALLLIGIVASPTFLPLCATEGRTITAAAGHARIP